VLLKLNKAFNENKKEKWKKERRKEKRKKAFKNTPVLSSASIDMA